MAQVLYCIAGGIAAYKAPEVVRELRRAGHDVRVLMTRAAREFVSELSLAAVAGSEVRSELFDVDAEGRIGHIDLATWPDVVLVAPATADLLARAAAGLADDLVTTCLLATPAPVVFAPAMNTRMWEHPATRDNLRLLAARGATFAGPDRGTLACGFVGEGRMLDPACLVDAVKQVLGAGSGSTPGPTVAPAWAGLRVLVTAGPTRAPIDAVRFLGNASTGAMGFAVAQAAAAAGAEVTLVAGPVELPTPPGVRRIDVVTAEEMLTALRAAQARPHDLVAMVAAVADLVVRAPLRDKLPKEHLVDAVRSLEWERAPDLLATLTSEFPRSFYLGFAAETVAPDADVDARLRDLGRAKLAAKGCQALFANRVAAPGTGFASPTNAGWLLLRAGDRVEEHSSGAPRAKAELARWVLAQLRPAVAGWRER